MKWLIIAAIGCVPAALMQALSWLRQREANRILAAYAAIHAATCDGDPAFTRELHQAVNLIEELPDDALADMLERAGHWPGLTRSVAELERFSEL